MVFFIVGFFEALMHRDVSERTARGTGAALSAREEMKWPESGEQSALAASGEVRCGGSCIGKSCVTSNNCNGAYWETRYATSSMDSDKTYDWLLGWDDVSNLLETIAPYDSHTTVLHLGCGNSTMPEEMYEAGYRQQTCIDISPSVIAHMEARSRSRPSMQWIIADCTDLTAVLASESFDLVIDKGTIDSFFFHEGDALMLRRFVGEAFRVTSSSGVYVSINFHHPKHVLRLLRQKLFHWHVRVAKLPAATGAKYGASVRPDSNSSFNYVYVCSKSCLSPQSLKNWPELEERVEAWPDSDLSSADDDVANTDE